MFEARSDEPVTRQKRRSDATRAKLLDAALKVFLEQGYDAAKLSEVTERADLGAGTLYLYFRDKRELYEAVTRRALYGLGERFRSRVAAGTEPLEQVVLMLRVAIEHLVAKPAESALFLSGGPALETWLVADVERSMAALLSDQLEDPVLGASLVIGAALAAGRQFLREGGKGRPEQLIDKTLGFCRLGLEQLRPGSARPGPARHRTSKPRGARR